MKNTKMKNWLITGFFAVAFMFFAGVALVGCKNNQPETVPEIVTQYSITYAGLDGATNPNTVTSFDKNTEQIALQDPVKEGFIFQGWTYKGQPVTNIDSSWGQDVTLVANWSGHYCHLELDWGGLTEANRFYFLNEPFSTGFYLYGQWISLAPKVYLVFGEDYQESEMQYYTQYVHVTGFDSKTVGTKHVTIAVNGVPAPNDSYYNASISYDVEVRDYNHDTYGYVSVSEDKNVTFPEGFTLSATPKNLGAVAQYNWMSSNESVDHADSCSTPNYHPYDFFTGSTAFTDTLDVKSSPTDSTHPLSFKLLTIYDDLTRVYTDEIYVNLSQPETFDNYARLGEYVFEKGETFDLAEHGLGSGTILFHDNGKEFTFTNVNYANDNYLASAFITSTGFEFFYSSNDENHYVIHLVGENYFINAYDGNGGGTGIAVNIQHIGSGDDNSDLTITGTGCLHLVGGEPALYVGCPLIIDNTSICLDSYMGRFCNGIDAFAIWVKGNSYIHATNRGTGMLAMNAGIQIDEDAVIDMRLATPRLSGRYATANAIYAAGDIAIYSKHVYVSIEAIADVYESIYEGIESCIAVCSEYGNVWFIGAKGEIHVLAMTSKNPDPLFGTAIGIATSEKASQIAEKGKVYIVNSDLLVDLQADLFATTYAVYGVHEITIEASSLDINVRCQSEMNGIYCSAGAIIIQEGKEEDSFKNVASIVNISGFRGSQEADAFGVFAFDTLTLSKSKLAVDYNNGYALVALIGAQAGPSGYDPDYVPTKLIGFDNVDGVSIASIVKGGVFYGYETIYDLQSVNLAATTHFVVDKRV